MPQNPAATRGQRQSVSILEPHPLALQYLVSMLEPYYKVGAWSDTLTNSPLFQSDAIIIDGGETPAVRSLPVAPPRPMLSKAKLIMLGHPLSTIQLCKLISLGIHGFVPYDQVDLHLQAAIQGVLRGHLWYAPEVLEVYVNYASSRRGHAGHGTALTPKEHVVVEMLNNTITNKELAAALGVTERSIRFHLANIFAKLEVHDRHALVELAKSSVFQANGRSPAA